MFSSEVRVRVRPQDGEITESDSETVEDTLETEINKLETTLNSIKDDLPDINDCSYELEEGEIIDSIIDERIQKDCTNTEVSNFDRTNRAITDSEVLLFGGKDYGERKTNSILKSRENEVKRSSNDPCIDQNLDKMLPLRRNTKKGLKLRKENDSETRPIIYSDIDSTDDEKIDPEVKIICRNRKRHLNDYIDCSKNIIPKHAKGSSSSGIILSPNCINCKENAYVPAHKKRCEGHANCQLDSSTPNKKNTGCKSHFTIISNNFHSTPVSSKNTLSNKKKEKCTENKEGSFRIDVLNIITTGALSENQLSENNEYKKSNPNAISEIELTEEGEENDISYIQLDISEEVENLLLSPDDFEVQSNALSNANIIDSTPHRPQDSCKTKTPTVLFDKESFFTVDQTGEFSNDKFDLPDECNSPSCTPVLKSSSKIFNCLTDVNVLKPKNTSDEQKILPVSTKLTNDNVDEKSVNKPKSISTVNFTDEENIISKEAYKKSLKENSETILSKENHTKDVSVTHTSHIEDLKHEPVEGVDVKNIFALPVLDYSLEQKNNITQIHTKNKDEVPIVNESAQKTDKLNLESVNILVKTETICLNELPESNAVLKEACKSPNKQENVIKESKDIMPIITSSEEIVIPEEKQKPSGKHDEDYISNNPEENKDNNNPEWELLRKLETDEERYRAMRKRWRNLVIPDPNQNLTCLNWRKIHNVAPSGSKTSESVPAINAKINKDLASSSTQREHRKRAHTVDSLSVRKEESVEKRARTQSCTTVYDVKLEQLRKNIEIEHQRIDNEENLAILKLRQRQSEELHNLQRSCSSVMVDLVISGQNEVIVITIMFEIAGVRT